MSNGTTYYNGAQRFQSQNSGRQDGFSSNDGKKNFDSQRKRERNNQGQRGYQGKNFDPDLQRKETTNAKLQIIQSTRICYVLQEEITSRKEASRER